MKLVKRGTAKRDRGRTRNHLPPRTFPPKTGPSATKLIALKGGGPTDKTQRRFASRLAYLRSSPKTDLSRLFLTGESEGGEGLQNVKHYKLGATQMANRRPSPFELKAHVGVLG